MLRNATSTAFSVLAVVIVVVVVVYLGINLLFLLKSIDLFAEGSRTFREGA